MKCRVCGSALRASVTDLPFKLSERTIVIIKNLPVEQCEARAEYLIADTVFAQVEMLLRRVDTSAELEIIPFAA
jgi:YgiT-type zinc finger domain-containing protein